MPNNDLRCTFWPLKQLKACLPAVGRSSISFELSSCDCDVARLFLLQFRLSFSRSVNSSPRDVRGRDAEPRYLGLLRDFLAHFRTRSAKWPSMTPGHRWAHTRRGSRRPTSADANQN